SPPGHGNFDIPPIVYHGRMNTPRRCAEIKTICRKRNTFRCRSGRASRTWGIIEQEAEGQPSLGFRSATMNSSVTYRWSFRLALLMAAIALLPIGLGAVVTTVEAGMAFADWPTSDGYDMLWYPWLTSTGDKFLEHGHRLAGMLIGIVSLFFTGWAL